MTIQMGERRPDATLTETTELGQACSVRPLELSMAELAKGKRIVKLGLDMVIPGMGGRSRRFSPLVDDGVVRRVNVEEPGKLVVSNVETMLEQMGSLAGR